MNPSVHSFVLTALLVLSAPTGQASPYEYKTYHHEPFRHLKFDILKDWKMMQNGLEVVFMAGERKLPRLHLQTLTKTEEYSDPWSFLAFLTLQTDQGSTNVKVNLYEKCSHPCIIYEHVESGIEGTYAQGLVVDVGEGLLWWHLKTQNNESGRVFPHPIIQRVIDSLEFR